MRLTMSTRGGPSAGGRATGGSSSSVASQQTRARSKPPQTRVALCLV